VAPGHPTYNPPQAKFILGAFAITAAMFAREAKRFERDVARKSDDVEFVVAFDDHTISLANPDGTVECARWDELEWVEIDPYDDPHEIWIGPYFIVLGLGDRRILIPAYSVGRIAFLQRLLALPGIDRERLEALLTTGQPSACRLWTREGEGPRDETVGR
jgi:hypothetical protein